MNEENTPNKRKKLIVQIAVLLVIALVAIGIWVVKNTAETPEFIADNPDFALNATEPVDLATLKSYNLPIILDYGTATCPACKELAPILMELNEELQGKAIIKYMDVGANPELTGGYPIRVVPTQALFDSSGNPYAPDPSNTSNPSNPYDLIMYSDNETGEHALTLHEGGFTKEQLLSLLIDMGMEQ